MINKNDTTHELLHTCSCNFNRGRPFSIVSLYFAPNCTVFFSLSSSLRFMYVSVWVSMYLCSFARSVVRSFVCLYTCICVCVWVCISFVCVRACLYVCLYVYDYYLMTTDGIVGVCLNISFELNENEIKISVHFVLLTNVPFFSSHPTNNTYTKYIKIKCASLCRICLMKTTKQIKYAYTKSDDTNS